MSTRDTVEPDPAHAPLDPEAINGHAALDGQVVVDDYEATDAQSRIQQLEEALASHAVVDQARGVLMATHRIDAEAAWGLLVRVSSHENIKVRTLAEAVIALVTSPVPARSTPARTAAIRYLLPRWAATEPG